MEIISENKRARFDYEISDITEAGIELNGQEVKSAKKGQFQIAGAKAIIRGGEVWLINSHIPPYQPKNAPIDYKEDRVRKLLIKRIEINKFLGKLNDKGHELIPIKTYLKNRLIKLEIGLGKIKRKSDKREAIKKQSQERDMKRYLN